MRIKVECRVEPTVRLQQAAAMFDLDVPRRSEVVWDLDAPPLAERPWNVGLIAGPSGSGKSTIARHLLSGDAFLWSQHLPPWPEAQSVLDGFPEGLSVKDVTELLSAVGFSSPPAWLRPYRVLSTGQQFRSDLARLLAFLLPAAEGSQPTDPKTAVMDEFTSVVDRTVAKIGSAALAKAVRRRGARFVGITCHEDVVEWMQPDWILRADGPTFAWRELRRRPAVDLELVRTTTAAWPTFRHHHYLNREMNVTATCFLASVKLPGEPSRPAAFSAWLPTVGKGPPTRREHRTVVLPDFQGIGIGHAISGLCASLWKAIGYRATSTTTHPAFVAARKRSTDWKMIRPPSLSGSVRDYHNGVRLQHATTRLTAGFEYVGPPMDQQTALRLVQERL